MKAALTARVSLDVRATLEASNVIVSMPGEDVPENLSPTALLPSTPLPPARPADVSISPIRFCNASNCLLPNVRAFAVTQTHNVG